MESLTWKGWRRESCYRAFHDGVEEISVGPTISINFQFPSNVYYETKRDENHVCEWLLFDVAVEDATRRTPSRSLAWGPALSGALLKEPLLDGRWQLVVIVSHTLSRIYIHCVDEKDDDDLCLFRLCWLLVWLLCLFRWVVSTKTKTMIFWLLASLQWKKGKCCFSILTSRIR